MSYYNLEEFKEWIKKFFPENIFPSDYFIKDEKLHCEVFIFGNRKIKREISDKWWKALFEIWKAEIDFREEIEQKKKKKKHLLFQPTTTYESKTEIKRMNYFAN